MKTWIIRAVSVLALAICAGAHGQTYPSKPVRIIVPYVPGGTVDLVARVLAQRLTEQMGQSFIVENKPGASGVIGSDLVAKAPADGYTLLVQSPTLVANPLMMKRVPYDVLKDFTAISLLGSVPMVMAAHPQVPGDDLKQFIEAVRSKPGGFSLGTSAVGSPMHLALESIKFSAKLDVPIIAYKGTGAALNDVLGGQTSAIIDAIPSSQAHIASGKLKAIAVTTRQRLPSMPQVPTVAESGLAGFEMVSWYGLWGPAKLPEDVARRLSQETAKAMNAPQVVDRLSPQGFVAGNLGPADFQTYITREIALYSRVVRDANIQID
jgi:tripartite-type tricarboxylate transporter receptor subunit TctC